ncbi:hypothetical protein BDR04DRAFT_1017843, partial [Suillus decipiens]
QESVKTTTVIDSRAARTFISKEFVNLHGINQRRLSKPFKVTTTDNTYIKGGPIVHYCLLVIKIDE